jgi:hypothetical protein
MSEHSLVDPDVRVAASEHVRSRQFDDELVIVDLEGGEYFALDAIGASMWSALVAGKTPAQVAVELAAKYEAEEKQVLGDCVRLVGDLVGRGLLIRDPR